MKRPENMTAAEIREWKKRLEKAEKKLIGKMIQDLGLSVLQLYSTDPKASVFEDEECLSLIKDLQAVDEKFKKPRRKKKEAQKGAEEMKAALKKSAEKEQSSDASKAGKFVQYNQKEL